MIQSFEEARLKRSFETGNNKGIPPRMVRRIERRLAALDDATARIDLGQFPGIMLHATKGNRKTEWAVWVTGSWRITFKFARGNVVDVDLEDYH